MIKIVSDSSCDLLKIEGVNFVSVPLTIYTDERSFTDDANLNLHEMLDYLASYKGRSYTSCPSIDAWLQAYEGGDIIYVVTLTSTLSGTYNSAMNARELYLQKHPEAKIHVFDTLSAGPEVRLLTEKIAELSTQGLSFEEVCAAGEEYIKQTSLLFAFQSLHNFAQNGRVSKVVAAAAGMLGIRVIGTASTEGELEVIAKARGEKKAMQELLKRMEKTGVKKGRIILSHTENPSGAKLLKSKIEEKFPEAQLLLYESRGLCSYYGEQGAIFLGMENY